MWDMDKNSAGKGGATNFGGQGAIGGVVLLLYQLPLDKETKYLLLLSAIKSKIAGVKHTVMRWDCLGVCLMHKRGDQKRWYVRGNYGKLAAALASR